MTAERPARVRRERGVTESLLSIVLALEAVLVFFVTLVAYGLKVVEPGLAFAGGAVLFVLLLITGRLVRYRAGIWLGWALQVVLVATGILIPLMYFVGALFAAIWIYCVVRARAIERQKAEFAAANPEGEPS
ncbi:DUF4233 domain-containing protein [soil metagenome]